MAQLAATSQSIADGSDECSEPSPPNDSLNDEADKELYSRFNALPYPEENVILEANEHILHAQAQRDLAKRRVQEVKESASH
jgi:hypothetical protein